MYIYLQNFTNFSIKIILFIKLEFTKSITKHTTFTINIIKHIIISVTITYILFDDSVLEIPVTIKVVRQHKKSWHGASNKGVFINKMCTRAWLNIYVKIEHDI